MDIAAANAGELDVDDDIVGRLEGREWPIFVLDAAGLLEDERKILPNYTKSVQWLWWGWRGSILEVRLTSCPILSV